MRIDQITDLQAIGIVGAIIAFAWLLGRLLPGDTVIPTRRRFTDVEITAYDAALPKYVLAGVVALAFGGLHAALKSLPPIYAWLATAGRGGHMARDLSNSHLNIVIGGTIIATAVTWYVLPRLTRRPLASPGLATWSFWCTVLGATGFYLYMLVFGLIFGRMHHDGIPYVLAKDSVGAWRVVTVSLSATIMGIGYWTFVANVFLTAWKARLVDEPRPLGYLVKFFVVGALGLLVGTVQGVIQVLPANEAWIQAAGPPGKFIDPISHAHVNLVTGTLSLVAGAVFYWTAAAYPRRWIAELTFWTMVPGSILFYLTFVTLGLVEGHLIVDQGLTYDQAVARLGLLHAVPLSVAGTFMLVGTWILFGVMVVRFQSTALRGQTGAALVVAAALALFVGTSQGLLQLMPFVKAWLLSAGEAGDAIVNAHAQINMLAGVVLALIGLVMLDAPTFFTAAVPPLLARRARTLVMMGVGIYYLAALGTNVILGEATRAGVSTTDALARVQPFGPGLIALGSALYGLGFGLLARFAWQATRDYRATTWRRFWDGLARQDTSARPWRRAVPARYFLGAEAAGAVFGFPGFGWIMSGRPLVGLPLALTGPAVAWALIPTLSSPYGGGPFQDVGALAVITYLLASATLSVTSLGLVIRRQPSEPVPRAPGLSRRPPVGEPMPAERSAVKS